MAAFLLTWKASGWPHENIVRMIPIFLTQGYVNELWRIKAHSKAAVGDRVWLLRQGRGPKGIFGAGEIVALPTLGETNSGKFQMMAQIQFNALVDPLERLLISESDVASILRPNQIHAPASGYPIDEVQSKALERLLVTKPPAELQGSGDWTPTEVNSIVLDYFTMLNKEVSGHSYSKTTHRDQLRKTVNRPPGSIERKHQNISAVLRELGLPWINGYKPLPNFQDALVDAVETQLGLEIERLDQLQQVLISSPTEIDVGSVFVKPPPARKAPKGRSISRVARKFDSAARDAANRRLGVAGESFVMEVERKKLTSMGRKDLAARVVWVSQDQGDGLGYDIESFDANGNSIKIEVKATMSGIGTPFFVSENERLVATELNSSFWLYRVFGSGINRRIYCIHGPLEKNLHLKPIVYRAYVG